MFCKEFPEEVLTVTRKLKVLEAQFFLFGDFDLLHDTGFYKHNA